MRCTASVWLGRRTVSTLGSGGGSTLVVDLGATLGSVVGTGVGSVRSVSGGGLVGLGRASSKIVASFCRLDFKVAVIWKGEAGVGVCKAVMRCFAAMTAASVVEGPGILVKAGKNPTVSEIRCAFVLVTYMR